MFVDIFNDDGGGVWATVVVAMPFVVSGSGLWFQFGFFFNFLIWVCGNGFGSGGY